LFKAFFLEEPYFRVVVGEDERLIKQLYNQQTRYEFENFRRIDLREGIPKELNEEFALILSPVLAKAQRVMLNAQDPLLKNVVERLAAMLDAAVRANPEACKIFLMENELTELSKATPSATDAFLMATEVAYLDGRRRTFVPIPSEDDFGIVFDQALQGPHALRQNELEAIDMPDAASPEVLCSAYSKFFYNSAANGSLSAAIIYRYMFQPTNAGV
jgi:hypothetical protein